MKHVVFAWQWWIGLLLAIIPWIIWIAWRKKESSDRMMYAGFFVIIVVCFLDYMGASIGLWYYYYDVLPFIPSFMPWDFTIFPVSTMALIEWRPQINPYLKATVFSVFMSFVGEPLIRWIGLYQPVKWHQYYSPPFYFCIYVAAYFISRRKQFKPINRDP